MCATKRPMCATKRPIIFFSIVSQRNAERFAKINFDVATAASVLWPAMMPGRDMRKKIKTNVVSREFLPFGPAEFYCELGKTDQGFSDKCFPQLNNAAYISSKLETVDGRPVDGPVDFRVRHLMKKSSLPYNEWAMSIDRSIDTEWRPKNNITKIEIASGAQWVIWHLTNFFHNYWTPNFTV